MSRLNTIFNASSAASNARTARNTAAIARSTDQLATADRHRELRGRGLITHNSTPTEIDEVEQRLAAQMRARIELEDGGPDRGNPYFLPSAGLTLVLTLFVPMSIASSQTNGAGGAVLLILIALALALVAVRRMMIIKNYWNHRDMVVARAAVMDGNCGWCGKLADHVIEGEPAPPRVFHATEVEHEAGPRP